MSVRKEQTAARVEEIVAASGSKKQEAPRRIDGLQCPKCGNVARATSAAPFSKWGIACLRSLAECAFVHELECVEGEGLEIAADRIKGALDGLKPANIAPKARSQFDLGGSPDHARARLAELGERLGRVHGKTTAIQLDKAAIADKQRIPWGILTMDLRTKGFVVGGINRLWGRRSSFKSTLCLRALRSAQRHCRHCKHAIVQDPETGARDCRCPNPRYWLQDEKDYAWLPTEAAVAISDGRLPEGARKVKIKGEGTFMALACEVPEHLRKAAAEKEAEAAAKAAKKGKAAKEPKAGKVLKTRDVLIVETYRCEPMRCLWLDGERSITKAWARANGVDLSLVLLVGGEWAEQCYGDLEEAILTKEFDFIVIDSTTVLESAANLEKSIQEAPVVAARANLQARFIKRYLSASFDGLTSRYAPTILATCQVSTHGIGYGQHAHLAPTDGNAWEHGLACDIKMTEEGYAYDKAGVVALHGQFGFEVMKDRAGGSPGSKGSVVFWLRETPEHPVGDSNDLETVMSYARYLGGRAPGTFITEGAGRAALTLFSPFIKSGKVEFARVGDCESYLRVNTTVYDDLRERVLEKLMADEQALTAVLGKKQ